jgi:hypothetical protein
MAHGSSFHRQSALTNRQIVVHKKMLALIGLTYDGENKSLTVPPIPDEPLVIPETGAAAADPQATSDGGVSQDPYIWTPDWRVGTVNPYNNAFVKHVAAQIIADEMHLDAKDVSEPVIFEGGRRLIFISACSCPCLRRISARRSRGTSRPCLAATGNRSIPPQVSKPKRRVACTSAARAGTV